MKNIKIGQQEFGKDNLFLIAGPCVVEDESIMMKTAENLKQIAENLKLPFIFKSSYIKDNRSSLEYYHGPGLEEGLKMLEKVKKTFDVPVISDVHQASEVKPAAEVLDVIQIPAYLCMQTSLVTEAAKTGKAINIKHGQFLAPENMIKPVQKIEHFGNKNIMVTERGYTFGYNDLIVDPRSFYELQQTGYPVIFDITHCIRRYGIPSSDPSGGTRQYLGPIARAGVAAGIDGIFIESHPVPSEALCDAASQYPLDKLEEFLKPLIEIHNIEKQYRTEN
jgi:2-dehydro-3-deoxyphosphooctonate aldolase (KDO 8-P synthase)